MCQVSHFVMGELIEYVVFFFSLDICIHVDVVPVRAHVHHAADVLAPVSAVTARGTAVEDVTD